MLAINFDHLLALRRWTLYHPDYGRASEIVVGAVQPDGPFL
jgi:hypothetical protein